MKDKLNTELENLENWDTDRVEVRQPKKPSRVVFSVAFRREDFDRVSKYAELNGKKTSEFIREAAIEKTQVQEGYVSTTFLGGSHHTSWMSDTIEMPTITLLPGYVIESPEPSVTT